MTSASRVLRVDRRAVVVLCEITLAFSRVEDERASTGTVLTEQRTATRSD